MTYYSDLLIVINELRKLEFGCDTNLSASELNIICKKMLEVDPDEFFTNELFDMLQSIPYDVQPDALGPLLSDRVRDMFIRFEHLDAA